MKTLDTILAILAGLAVALLGTDFLNAFGWPVIVALWITLPVVSVICLWFAKVLSKRAAFLYQIAKHVLVGSFATVVDLKLFEFLLAGIFLINPLIIKGVSFLFSTGLKYVGNKYWTFADHQNMGEARPDGREQQNGGEIAKEVAQFFFITLVGLAIDVSVFHYATGLSWVGAGLVGRQIPPQLWIKISVIFAAIAAAIWNFSGEKFFVFKK